MWGGACWQLRQLIELSLKESIIGRSTGNHGEAEALAEENLVLQNRVYGTAHPNAAAALELVGHVRAGLAAQAA